MQEMQYGFLTKCIQIITYKGTTLTTSRDVEHFYHSYLTLLLANVFSPQSIKDANPALRMAMEEVAMTAEKLAKDKATEVPLPFRKEGNPQHLFENLLDGRTCGKRSESRTTKNESHRN